MKFIENLHFIVGLIALINMAISAIGVVITIITGNELIYAITGLSLLIAILGTIIYNLWTIQLNKLNDEKTN